jgi:hypothetical protein
VRIDFRKLRFEQSFKAGIEIRHLCVIETEESMEQRTVEEVGETYKGIRNFQIEQERCG